MVNVLNEFSIFKSTWLLFGRGFVKVRKEAANIIQSCEEEWGWVGAGPAGEVVPQISQQGPDTALNVEAPRNIYGKTFSFKVMKAIYKGLKNNFRGFIREWRKEVGGIEGRSRLHFDGVVCEYW